MAAAPELLKFFSRKRKAEQEFLGDQYRLKEEMAKKRFRREMEFETEASQPARCYVSNRDYKKRQKRAWS